MTWGNMKSIRRNRMVPNRLVPSRFVPVGMMLACALVLSGCATSVIGSLTISQLSTIAGAASTATTGRGLQDHAISAVTGQDCRLLEGIFRRSRRICEEPGSPATENDFRGFVVMIMGPRDEDVADLPVGEPVVLYAGLADDYRPSMARLERRTGAPRQPLSLDEAGEMPTILEWAYSQPAPVMTTADLYTD